MDLLAMTLVILDLSQKLLTPGPERIPEPILLPQLVQGSQNTTTTNHDYYYYYYCCYQYYY